MEHQDVHVVDPAEDRKKIEFLAKWALNEGCSGPLEFLNMLQRLSKDAGNRGGFIHGMYAHVRQIEAQRNAIEARLP